MSKDMSNTTNANNLKKTKSYTLDTPFNDLQIRGWYLWIYVLFACSPLHDYHNLVIIQCLLELFLLGARVAQWVR